MTNTDPTSDSRDTSAESDESLSINVASTPFHSMLFDALDAKGIAHDDFVVDGMSIMTHIRVLNSGQDTFITADKSAIDEKWHAVLMINDPPPSGSPRFMVAISDNRGFDDAKTAIDEFLERLPAWYQTLQRAA